MKALTKEKNKPLAYKVDITSSGKLIIGFTEELQISDDFRNQLLATYNETRKLNDANEAIRIIPIRTD